MTSFALDLTVKCDRPILKDSSHPTHTHKKNEERETKIYKVVNGVS